MSDLLEGSRVAVTESFDDGLSHHVRPITFEKWHQCLEEVTRRDPITGQVSRLCPLWDYAIRCATTIKFISFKAESLGKTGIIFHELFTETKTPYLGSGEAALSFSKL